MFDSLDENMMMSTGDFSADINDGFDGGFDDGIDRMTLIIDNIENQGGVVPTETFEQEEDIHGSGLPSDEISMRIANARSNARSNAMRSMMPVMPNEISPTLRLNSTNMIQRVKNLTMVVVEEKEEEEQESQVDSTNSGTATNMTIQAPPSFVAVENTTITAPPSFVIDDPEITKESDTFIVNETSEEGEEEADEEEYDEEEYDEESEEEQETKKEKRRRKKKERKERRAKRRIKRQKRRDRKSSSYSSTTTITTHKKRSLVPMAMKKFKNTKMSKETRRYLFAVDNYQEQLDIYNSGIKLSASGFTFDQCNKLVLLFTRIGVNAKGSNGANSREIGNKYCNGRTFQHVRKVFMNGKFKLMNANPAAKELLRQMYETYHDTTTTTVTTLPPPPPPMVQVAMKPSVPTAMIPMDNFGSLEKEVEEEEKEEIDQEEVEELERLKKSERLYKVQNRMGAFRDSMYTKKRDLMDNYTGDYSSDIVIEKVRKIVTGSEKKSSPFTLKNRVRQFVDECEKNNSLYKLEKDHKKLMAIRKSKKKNNSSKKRSRDERDGGVADKEDLEKASKKRKLD